MVRKKLKFLKFFGIGKNKMNDYQRGRRDGMIEAMNIWCPFCKKEDKYPIEYVEQLSKWFHRLSGGLDSSSCSADELRKLIEREFETETEIEVEIVRPKGAYD